PSRSRCCRRGSVPASWGRAGCWRAHRSWPRPSSSRAPPARRAAPWQAPAPERERSAPSVSLPKSKRRPAYAGAGFQVYENRGSIPAQRPPKSGPITPAGDGALGWRASMQQRATFEPPSPPRARTFASLSVPSFRVLWAGTWASYVPFFMAFAVNSVVAFELAGVNRAVGTVSFAQGLAMVFLAPLGGAAADRWPKRRLLALSQSVSALVFGT